MDAADIPCPGQSSFFVRWAQPQAANNVEHVERDDDDDDETDEQTSTNNKQTNKLTMGGGARERGEGSELLGRLTAAAVGPMGMPTYL